MSWLEEELFVFEKAKFEIELSGSPDPHLAGGDRRLYSVIICGHSHFCPFLPAYPYPMLSDCFPSEIAFPASLQRQLQPAQPVMPTLPSPTATTMYHNARTT